MRWLLCLLLAGCATAPPIAAPVSPTKPQPCKTLDRGLLKPVAKAEGVLDLADQVASERGKQVITLNGRLTAIAKALDGGCIQ